MPRWRLVQLGSRWMCQGLTRCVSAVHHLRAWNQTNLLTWKPERVAAHSAPSTQTSRDGARRAKLAAPTRLARLLRLGIEVLVSFLALGVFELRLSSRARPAGLSRAVVMNGQLSRCACRAFASRWCRLFPGAARRHASWPFLPNLPWPTVRRNSRSRAAGRRVPRSVHG